jgi:hypothetical protein
MLKQGKPEIIKPSGKQFKSAVYLVYYYLIKAVNACLKHIKQEENHYSYKPRRYKQVAGQNLPLI